MFGEVAKAEGYAIVVDLQNQLIQKPNGSIPFNIDLFRKRCLLEGLDDISMTLKHEEMIRSYEEKLKPFQMIDVRRE